MNTFVGYITVVGRPNVGKSSYVNGIINFNSLAISKHPHTTRKNFFGIYTKENIQIIFIDTPGIHKSINTMGKIMNAHIKNALELSNLIVCIIDPSRMFGDEDKAICMQIKNSDKKCLLLINKIDICSDEQIEISINSYLKYIKPYVDDIVHISCKKKKGLNLSIDKMKKYLCQNDFIYPSDQVSTSSLKSICEEIIREKAVAFLKKELPHSLAVNIIDWNETDKQIKISAYIYLEREGQKVIFLGKNGSNISEIIKLSQRKINKISSKFIKLKLYFKIKNNWQNNIRFLKENLEL